MKVWACFQLNLLEYLQYWIGRALSISDSMTRRSLQGTILNTFHKTSTTEQQIYFKNYYKQNTNINLLTSQHNHRYVDISTMYFPFSNSVSGLKISDMIDNKLEIYNVHQTLMFKILMFKKYKMFETTMTTR